MAETSIIQETNLRVFTRDILSFPLSLAMLFLTLTSARRRDNGPPGRPMPLSAAFVDDGGNPVNAALKGPVAVSP